MVREATERLGGLDILVNNAGIQISRPSEQLTSHDFDKVITVDLRGAFWCAREAINVFLSEQKPGVVINLSSVHEVIPRPRYLSYSVSEGGMGNVTRTLALEYARHGIRVNGVGPGATITPINRAWIDDPIKTALCAAVHLAPRFRPLLTRGQVVDRDVGAVLGKSHGRSPSDAGGTARDKHVLAAQTGGMPRDGAAGHR